MTKRTRSAGGIVIGNSGTIAMVRNQRAHLWLFPKGHIEEGEEDELAARREIQEETGLRNLEYIDDLGTYERYRLLENGSDDTSELKEVHMFLFSASETALHPTMEIEEAAWIPLQAVAEKLGSDKERVWFTGVFDRVRQAIQRD